MATLADETTHPTCHHRSATTRARGRIVKERRAAAGLVAYQERSQRMLPQTTELTVRDVKIKLYRAGSGPTVLFLHGEAMRDSHVATYVAGP
jgi:hypothetical protein